MSVQKCRQMGFFSLSSFYLCPLPPPLLPTPLLGILSSTYETPTKPPTMFSFMEFHRFSLVSRYTGRASSSIVPGEQRNMLLPPRPPSNIDIVSLNSKHKNAITHIESACMRYFSSFGFTLSLFQSCVCLSVLYAIDILSNILQSVRIAHVYSSFIRL